MTGIPVCVFAKPPTSGEVKTRLALSIGKQPAASLASAMLCDVWSTLQSVSGVIPILAAAELGLFPIQPPRENLWLQEPGDLGARMEQILRRGLHTARAAIVLGADSPLLTAHHLQDALQALTTNHAVIGPSHDGGFYLLGLDACPVGLLQNLPWSSVETRESTVERLRSHGMGVCPLKPLSDVDTLADLQLLHGELQSAASDVAPATRRWFAEYRPHFPEPL